MRWRTCLALAFVMFSVKPDADVDQSTPTVGSSENTQTIEQLQQEESPFENIIIDDYLVEDIPPVELQIGSIEKREESSTLASEETTDQATSNEAESASTISHEPEFTSEIVVEPEGTDTIEIPKNNQVREPPSLKENATKDSGDIATLNSQTISDSPSPTPKIPPILSSPAPEELERFNYASFDCGSLILAANRDAKSATNILIKNKDSYMLNKCEVNNKYVIVELCQEILVDDIFLANYEYFSSMVKEFRVFVTSKYQGKDNTKWLILGDFLASNTRGLQSFKVENSKIWSKYLKIEFVSQYGKEYYCPLSVLKVFGVTMMEDLKRHHPNMEGIQNEPTKEETLIKEVYIPPSSSSNTRYRSPLDFNYENDMTKIASNKNNDYRFKDLKKFTSLELAEKLTSMASSFSIDISSSSSDTPIDEPEETQENIFKNIINRIKNLELNSTKSITFLQAQTGLFLEYLNEIDNEQQERMGTLFLEFNSTLSLLFRDLKRFDDGWKNIFEALQQEKSDVDTKLFRLFKKSEELSEQVSNLIMWQTLCILLVLGPLLYRIIPTPNILKLTKLVQATPYSRKDTIPASPSLFTSTPSVHSAKKKRKRAQQQDRRNSLTNPN